MKGLATPAARSMTVWLGRAFWALGTAALGAIAWLGWTSAGAQASLETLWGLCGVR